MIQSIDKEKCIGCGTCQKMCPLDVFRVHIDSAVASPCAAQCPIHNNIKQYHWLLQMGEVEKAAALMWSNNSLAAVTGRVCPHLCESRCSRAEVDSAVNIAGLERFLGDRALEQRVEKAGNTQPAHVFPVAVVGSGPAGLTCAAELAARGFDVTVFEAKAEPGGMLRYGIPEYRLPPLIIAKYLAKLRSMGVSFHCNQALGKHFSVQSLKEQGFGAVFLGLGAGLARKVDVPGGEQGCVADIAFGLDFLQAVRTRELRVVSGRAMVVGGGDVAMDVAQSLIRLGADAVSVVSLEAQDALPAFAHNVEDAAQLGVHFIPSASVHKVVRKAGRLSEVVLIPCTNVFDESGAFAPAFDPSQPYSQAVDYLVFAVGQQCDLTGVPEEIWRNKRTIAVHAMSGQSAVPYVFAAGDVVTGPNSVASAIGGAKRAATAIELFLRGGDLETLTEWNKPVTTPLDHAAEHRTQVRQEVHKQKVVVPNRHSQPEQERGNAFAELYTGLSLSEALAEGNRCLTCGASASISHPDDCMTCFSCELYCPQQAIRVSPIKEVWPRALAPLPPCSPDFTALTDLTLTAPKELI